MGESITLAKVYTKILGNTAFDSPPNPSEALIFCTNGSIGNTFVANKPLARLTIGVTGSNGKRAVIAFKRDDATTDLVAQVPAEIEAASELPPPTPDELDAHYLTKTDWQMSVLEGVGEVWEDPISGGSYPLEIALAIQAGREFQDLIAEALSFEDAPIASFYANAETPLGDEIYGGE